MNILLLLVLLYCGHLAEGVLNILIDLHGKTIFHVPDVFELVCVKKKSSLSLLLFTAILKTMQQYNNMASMILVNESVAFQRRDVQLSGFKMLKNK